MALVSASVTVLEDGTGVTLDLAGGASVLAFADGLAGSSDAALAAATASFTLACILKTFASVALPCPEGRSSRRVDTLAFGLEGSAEPACGLAEAPTLEEAASWAVPGEAFGLVRITGGGAALAAALRCGAFGYLCSARNGSRRHCSAASASASPLQRRWRTSRPLTFMACVMQRRLCRSLQSTAPESNTQGLRTSPFLPRACATRLKYALLRTCCLS
mmetsp:Transcript_105935/g.294788  ORF Transcript_105935/g.294788 Transcript_105935/m.294788 type:complete len:218 (+) Transcript_105935:439-1092(+)